MRWLGLGCGNVAIVILGGGCRHVGFYLGVAYILGGNTRVMLTGLLQTVAIRFRSVRGDVLKGGWDALLIRVRGVLLGGARQRATI